MIRFTDYAKICNNYCICYFGYADEYLVQLRMIQPIIEKRFEGLNVFIGCRDEKINLLKDYPKVLKISDLKLRKDEFAHIRELQFNGVTHPVEDLISEIGEADYRVNVSPPDRTVKCVIVTKSIHPTSSLLEKQITSLKFMAQEEGYSIEMDSKDVANAGLVMGVESYSLFEAASLGIETRLVPTGVGTRLYKRLALNPKVLNI